MNEVLARRFAEIGARLEIDVESSPWGLSVDVRGDTFAIRLPTSETPTRLDVIDVDRASRQLLLLVRDGDAKSKFLCGHDERHWFVAAVPNSERGVIGVATAKLALQPKRVRGVPHVRQGEWFFVPEPTLRVENWFVLRNEPIRRVNGTPHIVQSVFRRGGRYPAVFGQGTVRHPDHTTITLQGWHRVLLNTEHQGGAVRHVAFLD